MPHDPQPLDLDAIEAAARGAARIGSGIHPDTTLVLADEIRRLRAELAEAREGLAAAVRVSETLHRRLSAEQLAGSALYAALTMPTTPEQRQAALDKFTAVAQQVSTAATPPAVEAHVVADDSDNPEHVDDFPGCEDTLPAWLAQRFDPRSPDWEQLSDDDRAYWEHHARAVRRAVARNGFKATQAGADDEGLSGPCDCGEGAVHYTLADCPAAQRAARS